MATQLPETIDQDQLTRAQKALLALSADVAAAGHQASTGLRAESSRFESNTYAELEQRDTVEEQL